SPEAAQRSIEQRIAQVVEQREIGVPVDALYDATDHPAAPRGADAARRALAARLNRTELHRVAGHLRHIDGVVECDDSAVSDERADLAKRLVIERRVELRFRQIRAERAADLHRPDRPPRRAPLTIIIENFADGGAKCLRS